MRGRIISIIAFVSFLSSCTFYENSVKIYETKDLIKNTIKIERNNDEHIFVAYQFLNYDERLHRAELRQFIGVDPVRTEWCAAFLNAVLNHSGIPGSESVSNYPLTAKSFLTWGIAVRTPKRGDIVIYNRGLEAWQGHVGIYLGEVVENNRTYYLILGGNQNNIVSIDKYRKGREIAIRRYSDETEI